MEHKRAVNINVMKFITKMNEAKQQVAETMAEKSTLLMRHQPPPVDVHAMCDAFETGDLRWSVHRMEME